MSSNMYKVLVNGVKMPSIGFGTYKLIDEKEAIDCLKTAINLGYRQIDTAYFYKNEKIIGKGIREAGVDRKEIFLVSKLWNDEHGYDKTIEAFNRSLKNLNTDYLDLYLIHWPNKLNKDTWRAFEDLYEMGKIKSIGVCNFKKGHLEELKKTARIMPMVNQIEIHPCKTQKDMVSYCMENNIQLVAWGPIMRGKIFSIPLLNSLAKKYNKNEAQIILRWHIQNGIIPIPKSSNIKRIKENFDVFDFEILEEDMVKIDKLNKNEDISGVPNNTTYLNFD